MECQYCANEFSSKTSLINHQKRAKYCIDLRQEIPDNLFKCLNCDKVLLIKVL